MSSNTVEYSSIIAIAQEVGGEGFDDLSSADIDELLLDKALSDDEIIGFALETAETKEISEDDKEVPTLTASIVKEGLQMAAKLGDHFRKHDSNEERTAKFQRELKLLMGSYRELHNSLKKTGSQRLITEFVTKITEPSPATEHDFENISSDDSDIFRKRMRLSESDTD